MENISYNKKYDIKIKHANSINYKGLQIADLVSWSLYQSVENKNETYIELLNNKIIKEVFNRLKNPYTT